MRDIINTKDYISFLNEIKIDIQTSRIKAHLAVNKELILLYWRIGNSILKRQSELGWGSGVIEELSKDLKMTFPNSTGFSKQNLWYMRQFAGEYDAETILQRPIGEIPWGHNIDIFTKVKDTKVRFWYVNKTIENGWSRNVLLLNIKSESHLKLGSAQTNFHANLPKPQSDLAQELIKSEYNFDFLGLSSETHY